MSTLLPVNRQRLCCQKRHLLKVEVKSVLCIGSAPNVIKLVKPSYFGMRIHIFGFVYT
jgi:hypothetical protein